MESSMKFLKFNMLTILVLIGCDDNSGNFINPIFSSLEGKWEWRQEDSTCSSNPHTLRFVESENKLIIEHEKMIDSYNGEKYKVAEYDILGAGKESIALALVGETRTDRDSNLVTWELKLISPNEYCWRESDWAKDACTPKNYRCN